MCGKDSGVDNKPFLWHPHAGDRDHGAGAELSVCVKECPTAHDWVCVDADVATAFDESTEESSVAENVADASFNASAPVAVAPPPTPPPRPPPRRAPPACTCTR